MAADIDHRLHQHNLGKAKSTKAFIPWKVIYSEQFNTFEEAREREKFFKTATGRRFLKPIKDNFKAQDS